MDNTKIIKKFAALRLVSTTVNQEVKAEFEFGRITGPYYSQEHPKEEFDTEQEAIEYAFEQGRYGTWMIVPIIRFEL